MTTKNTERALFWALLMLLVFSAFADFYYARATPINSDNVQNFNELEDFFKGNFLLHGWCLATDNFYFTDLPFYLFFAGVFGKHLWQLYFIPYFVFMLFISGCLMIVYQSGKTRNSRLIGCLATIILVGLPYTFAQDIFLKSAIHGSTIMMSVYGLAFGQRILENRPDKKLFLMLFCLIVFAVAASDPQADAYFLLPFIVVFFVRLWLYSSTSRSEVLVLQCIIFFGFFGSAFPYIMVHHGGFELASNFSLGFVPSIPAAVLNTISFLNALAMSFDARSVVSKGLLGSHFIASTRLLSMSVILFFCFWVFIKMPGSKNMIFAQWLMMSFFVLAASDTTSAIFAARVADSPFGFPVVAVRYVLPAYVCSSLCGIIAAQIFFDKNIEILSKKILFGTGSFLSVCYLFGAVQVLYRDMNNPPFINTMPQRNLAEWLEVHDLTYGVGDYWTSQTVTALSRGKVVVDEVIAYQKVVPYRWIGNMKDLDAGRPPEFVVFTPLNDQFVPTDQNITIQNVIETYGKPKAVFNVDGFIVAELIN